MSNYGYEYILPPRRGIIKNFGNLSPVALKRMAEDLGLLMDVGKLAFCASVYRNKNLRDPEVSEICFIDALISETQKMTSRAGITELLTDDALLAETYADMMNKRRDILPEHSMPPTIEELTHIGDRWLKKAGLNTDTGIGNGYGFYTAPDSRAVEAAHGLTAGDFCRICGHAASVYRKVRTNVRAGGATYLLLSPSTEKSPEDFDEFISDIVLRSEISCQLLDAKPVREGGLVMTLMNMTDGMNVNLSALPSRSDGTHSPTDLCTMYKGAMVISCAPKDAKSVKEYFESRGCICSLIGASGSSGILTAVYDNNTVLNVKYDLLRAVSGIFGIQIKLPEDRRGFIPSPSRESIRTSCNTLTCYPFGASAELTDDHYICAAHAKTADSPFRASYMAVCSSILRAAAIGGDLKETVLGISLTSAQMPADPYEYGYTVSSLLGAYRAQMDLCVSSTGCDLSRVSDDKTNYDIAVFSLFKKPGKIISRQYTCAGHRVCLLTPKMLDSGLPDVAELKGMLGYLSKLQADGKVFSALAFEGMTASQAADGLNGNFAVKTAFSADERLIPLGIIIETDEIINGSFIGMTIPAREVSAKAPSGLYESLLYRPTPKVLIQTDANTPDASALCRMFGNHGAVCEIADVDNSRASCGLLSERIFGADVVVFASGEEFTSTLLAEKRVSYALSKLLRRGGLVMALGRASVAFAKAGLTEPTVDSCEKLDESSEIAEVILKSSASPWLSDYPEISKLSVSDGVCLIPDGNHSAAAANIHGRRFVAYTLGWDGQIICAPLGCCDALISSALRYFS